MKRTIQSLLTAGLLLAGIHATLAAPATWKIEAENAGPGDINPPDPTATGAPKYWAVVLNDGASGGQVLAQSAGGESHGIATHIPHAGAYRVWVRHVLIPGYASGIGVLFRDETEGVVVHGYVDSDVRRLRPERPYDQKPAPDQKAKKPPGVLAWTAFDATFERPADAKISFIQSYQDTYMLASIDCVVISDDPTFDPTKADLATLPPATAPVPPPATPGLKPVQTFTMHSTFFSGVDKIEDQFRLALINQPAFFDYPVTLQMGANRGHGWSGGSLKFGVLTMTGTQSGYSEMPRALANTYPEPEGRFVTAAGTASKAFSYSFEPYRQACLDEIRKDFPGLVATRDDVDRWIIADEGAGRIDYSTVAKERFHKWLANRYPSIEKLNELWKKNYKSFDEIEPPILNVDLRGVRAERTPGDVAVTAAIAPEDIAAFFAFREFSGLEYVTTIADTWAVASPLDPKQRGASTQASNIPLFAPGFTVRSPMDWEDLVNVGLKDVNEVGWDGYAVDDYQGCEVELLLSLAGKRILVNQEWNTHAQDPNITARSFWTMIGKGVRGVYCYKYHQQLSHWASPMWSLTDTELQPRWKLGALSDAFHEIHRLERLLTTSKRQTTVKPVAMYYSRLDLSLPQPSMTPYDGAVDSPHRTYALLRSLGYPVTWVTPRQIEAGALKDVAALVLVGVKYIPGAPSTKIAEWVKDGGVLIGDSWPGAFDEYGHPQKTLAEVFGIRAAAPVKATKDAQLALEEARALSYGDDVTMALTLKADELTKNIAEMFDQWDSTHPVAKQLGNWHLSGYDLKRVDCLAGQVIGQAYGGVPGVVINDYGQGHALYVAMMLGCLFEASPTQFEWDTTRSGTSLQRLLDAYLKFAGVQKFSSSDLPERVGYKIRVESPLVDAKGNALVSLISMNDMPLAPFTLTLHGMKAPKQMFAAVNGSRKLIPVEYSANGDQLRVKMPGFDSFAMLIAANDCDPLVGLEVSGERGHADLLEVNPKSKLVVKATIHNPSSRKLPAGMLNLYAPLGWLCDRDKTAVPAIPAFGSTQVSFTLMTPEICSARQLKPIVAKYESGKVTSTPATEVVWWINPGNQ